MDSDSLTQADRDLLGQMARFTERRGQHGVFMLNGISESLGVPVTFICALGEQATGLNDLIMRAQVEQSPIEIVRNLHVSDDVKRQFGGGH